MSHIHYIAVIFVYCDINNSTFIRMKRTYHIP